MQQKVALAMFAILLISNIGASAPANENVLHPNIVRAMNDAEANTQIEFIVQYRPELTNQHLQTAEGIGIEVISICLLYTSPSPRDTEVSRMPSSA